MPRPTIRPTPFPSAPAKRVLFALARYPFLTSFQATLAAGYPITSRKYVGEALTEMTRRDYTRLDYTEIKRAGKGYLDGSGRGYWTLGPKGRHWLERQGVDILPDHVYRTGWSMLFLSHSLDVNDVLIAAEQFAKTNPVQIDELLHEQWLAHSPKKVQLRDKTVQVTPDGWINLWAADQQFCLWVEVDRDTESQDRWTGKIEAIVTYAGQPYRQEYGEDRPLRVAVLTTGGTKRRRWLETKTKAMLQAMGKPAWAELFRFTEAVIDADPKRSDVNPDQLFLSPLWYRIDDPEPLPLLQEVAG